MGAFPLTWTFTQGLKTTGEKLLDNPVHFLLGELKSCALAIDAKLKQVSNRLKILHTVL